MTTLPGFDGNTYTSIATPIVNPSQNSNNNNYYASTNNGNDFYKFTVTKLNFTNNGIILAAGGFGNNGGNALFNETDNTIDNFINNGALLGGGGGGASASQGGAGGGGGPGANGAGGSLIYAPTSGGEYGGGGGGPGQDGASIESYPGGKGGGSKGGNGGGGNADPSGGFIFGGGGGHTYSGSGFGGGGGGYGGGNGQNGNITGGGGGGGGLAGGLAGGVGSMGYNGGYSIYNSGNIKVLTNLQGGKNYIYGPLYYAGNLPTKYNIKINSSSSYGQLYIGPESYNLTTTIDITSSVSVIPMGTYTNVIYGIASNKIVNYSTISGENNFTVVNRIQYFWKLVQSSTNIYDLIIYSTRTGVDNISYSLITSSFINVLTSDSNYAGTNLNDGTIATYFGSAYYFTSNISSFTNNNIILAAGGNSSKDGGSAIYITNTATINTVTNYGYLLGGGGGGNIVSLNPIGGAGGGGAGGDGQNTVIGNGGSLIYNANSGVSTLDRNGGGGGGPGGGLGGVSYYSGGGVGGSYNNSTGYYIGGDGYWSFFPNESGGAGGGYGRGKGYGPGGAGGGGGGIGVGGGNGGYSIRNDGTIVTLNNSQSGNSRYGPLFYAGVLPTNYNVKIVSDSSYGQLYCGGAINYSGNMTFGIDPTSVLNYNIVTVPIVLVGIDPINITNYAEGGNIFKNGKLYYWYLLQRPSVTPVTIDLFITIVGSDNILYIPLSTPITSIPSTNTTNYFGDTNISGFSNNNTVTTFTNSAIVLGGGGGSGLQGAHGLSNIGTINVLFNYGAFLGGGGGGGVGGAGGAGGGGGAGYIIVNEGGSFITSVGGGGGGRPGGSGGGIASFTGGSGGGRIGGNGASQGNGGDSINIGGGFTFGGGGGAWDQVTNGSGGGGYGGGNGGTNVNGTGGGGGGGGFGGTATTNRGGNGGYSIYNTGTITTLYNSQGGPNSIYGPLFYGGSSLPTNYYFKVNSATSYGQLFCIGWNTPTQTNYTAIDIDPTSNIIGDIVIPQAFVGNCFNVISKITKLNNGYSILFNIVASTQITIGSNTYNSYDISINVFPGYGIIAASSLMLNGFLNNSPVINYYINGINQTNANSGIVSINNSSSYVSLYASFIVASGLGFTINSDQRIKKNIEYLSSAKSLELINALKPSTFQYVDYMKGSLPKYGYLAQDIETVFPNIVYTNPAYIPNFYEIVKIEDSYTILLNEKNTEALEIGIKIQFYDIHNDVLLREVKEIIDIKTFTVTEPFLDGTDTLFLYGQEVADYRSIDTDQINTVLLSALQETNKIIVNQNKKIDELTKITEDLRKDLNEYISKK